jgi:hypothetical protein
MSLQPALPGRGARNKNSLLLYSTQLMEGGVEDWRINTFSTPINADYPNLFPYNTIK